MAILPSAFDSNTCVYSPELEYCHLVLQNNLFLLRHFISSLKSGLFFSSHPHSKHSSSFHNTNPNRFPTSSPCIFDNHGKPTRRNSWSHALLIRYTI